jgi:thermopsin
VRVAALSALETAAGAFFVLGLLVVSGVGATPRSTPASEALGSAAPGEPPQASNPGPAAPVIHDRVMVPTSSAPTLPNPPEAYGGPSLAAAKAAGVPAQYVFPPRPSATPAQLAAANDLGYAAPLYTGQPAPMGLAFDGLSSGPNGSVIPSVLNTSSVRGFVDSTGTGIASADLYQNTPDAFSIQLNAVATGVDLGGPRTYSFWAQDVVEYYPDAGRLVLISNLWNFSGGALPASTLYAHGPLGADAGGSFYYAAAAFDGVRYPWNLTLTLTSNVTDRRDSLYFAASLSGPSVPIALASDTFDYVVFNSPVPGNLTGSAPAAAFTASGTGYNDIGLPDDFELTFGGPGSGSQADLGSADALLGLAYWDGSGYVAVPSALGYGSETGETSTGADITWTSAATGGPGGLATFATMTSGPSVLRGLWNASVPEGSFPLVFAVTPANAFEVVTPVGAAGPFLRVEAAVVPGAFVSSIDLPPGNYSVETELSDYRPVETSIDLGGPYDLEVNLTPDPSAGLYTPLWASSNSQVAALASTGNGTPSSPFVLFGGASASLGPAYGLYNDYGSPVYPGLFLRDTNVSVEIDDEPPIIAATNTVQSPGPRLPSTNALQSWFWNVSNVSIVRTNFSGEWAVLAATYPTFLDPFSAIFYASSHNLLWRDTFESPSWGLLLYQGGSWGGPSTGAGGNNTVWGSTFVTGDNPGDAGPALLPYSVGLGLEVAEGNDTIFNNYFATPTTAWDLPIDLYSGAPSNYPVRWNVTPGTSPPPAPGFPLFPLSGLNVIGGPAQGGNYWWDYGDPLNIYNLADNPLGGLPYVENASPSVAFICPDPSGPCQTFLRPGGDYAPLTYPQPQFDLVRFVPQGILSPLAREYMGFEPEVNLIGRPFPTLVYWDEGVVPYWLPVGSFTYAAWVTTDGPLGAPYTTGTFAVPASTTVRVDLAPASHGRYLVIQEVGLPRVPGASNDIVSPWAVLVTDDLGYPGPGVPYDLIFATNVPVAVMLVPKNAYPFVEVSYQSLVGNGFVPKNSSSVVHHLEDYYSRIEIPFVPYLFSVTFGEVGLPPGATWCVTIGLRRSCTDSSSLTLEEANGTHPYTPRTTTAGYLAARGIVDVRGAPAAVAVVFARR